MNTTPAKNKTMYTVNAQNFSKIPGSPIAYWASNTIVALYNNRLVSDVAFSDGQILTGDNNKYLRLLWEVNCQKICKEGTWMFHVKGGEFRRWYGNLDTVVSWSESSREHYKNDKIARFPKESILFREGVTWTLISSGGFGTRYLTNTQTFNKAAATLLLKEQDVALYLLGFTNTKIAGLIMGVLNPTLNTNIRDVLALPFISNSARKQEVDDIVRINIRISKSDWDSFEASWDFKKHPLI